MFEEKKNTTSTVVDLCSDERVNTINRAVGLIRNFYR